MLYSTDITDTNIITKVKLFAQGSNNNYQKRNQFNQAKIQNDIFTGKMSEFAVHEYLEDKVEELSEPDLKIYKGRQKRFDFDLTANGYNFHVKSQTKHAAEEYGESWTFQFSDSQGNGCDKNIFGGYSENDYVCFVLSDESNYKIEKIVKVSEIQKKFALPRIKRLQDFKRVIYLEDIKEIKDMEFKNERV
jgi:hypothetical protein